MRSLEPAIKTIWMIKYAAFSGVLVIGAMMYEVFQYFAGSARAVPFGIMTAALLVTGFAITWFVPRLRYRYWRFDLRTEELYLERGVLNRVRTVVPLRRIQHLDVSQNILERSFDLSKLIVHTAGSRSSDVVLPGLNIKEAEELRNDVKRYILEDAV